MELKQDIGLPGSIKVAAAKMAKFILGAANRPVADAARAFGGSALLLVGVSKQGDLVGVEQVDSANWSDSVLEYFGSEKPRWDYQWVRYEEYTLMAVTVEPPKQGDPIYRAYSKGEGVQDGDVFIRTDAKTRKATAIEQGRLDQRAKSAPDASLEVSCAARMQFVDLSIAKRVIASWAESHTFSPAVNDFIRRDGRSAEEYRREIGEWKHSISSNPSEEVLDALAVHSSRAHQGSLSVKNVGTRDLQNVQVVLQLPPGVRALVADDDPDWQVEQAARLPRDWASLDIGVMAPVRGNRDDLIEVIEDGDHLEMVWHLDHLPPARRRDSEEKIGIWTYGNETPRLFDWRVTAAGLNDVIRGTLRLDQ
ncbi:hypothetical protein [Citricoccus sp. GCM10030269]|uniref:hypothetical protein n=1 Tax=Citricoccus sp. GCM10030269 TaxID=3273388 RepID=UPI00366B90CE